MSQQCCSTMTKTSDAKEMLMKGFTATGTRSENFQNRSLVSSMRFCWASTILVLSDSVSSSWAGSLLKKLDMFLRIILMIGWRPLLVVDVNVVLQYLSSWYALLPDVSCAVSSRHTHSSIRRSCGKCSRLLQCEDHLFQSWAICSFGNGNHWRSGRRP